MIVERYRGEGVVGGVCFAGAHSRKTLLGGGGGHLGEQWWIQVLKKEGARLHKILKLTDFGPSFTLKKV